MRILDKTVSPPPTNFMIYANPVRDEPTAGALLMTGNREFNGEGELGGAKFKENLSIKTNRKGQILKRKRGKEQSSILTVERL